MQWVIIRTTDTVTSVHSSLVQNRGILVSFFTCSNIVYSTMHTMESTHPYNAIRARAMITCSTGKWLLAAQGDLTTNSKYM